MKQPNQRLYIVGYYLLWVPGYLFGFVAPVTASRFAEAWLRVCGYRNIVVLPTERRGKFTCLMGTEDGRG